MNGSTKTRTNPYPPGPNSGRLGLRLLSYYQNDTLNFLRDAASYGDLVHFQLGPTHFYLVKDPEDLHKILIEDADKFRKPEVAKKVIGKFLGNGLLLSDGTYWRKQRRLVQPAFHRMRIDAYGQMMVDLSLKLTDRWRDGEMRDVAQDMMRLTLNIVAKTLFDVETEQMANRIDAAMTIIHKATSLQMRSLFYVDWLPTEANREWRQAIATLRGIIEQIIRERRASGKDRGDLLSMLLLAKDEDGVTMNDDEARDEAMTIFLAGHDTTANALTWAWYSLAQHPEVEAKLHAELQRVLGDRPPTLQDLSALPYTDMIIKEVLRLYPPAYMFLREPTEDVVIGGYPVKKGSMVFIAPYILHRNPKYFDDPESFKPERFVEGFEKSLPRMTYLPFSTGPRICIGNNFALMEARLVLATIAQRYHLSLLPGHEVRSAPLITLRTKDGLPMEIRARKATAVNGNS